MDEAFLHFIWKFQKFDSRNLVTTDNEPLSIYHTGNHNHDSGPDFSEARIQINNLEWSGHVEIHTKSSEWKHHGHNNDAAYDNVILHVVYKDDFEVKRQDGTKIPCLELQARIDLDLIQNYRLYVSQPTEILCHSYLKNIPDIIWNSNLDSNLTRRLEQKSRKILHQGELLRYDWEEVTYKTLARNFGFSLNAEAFERLAYSLPLRIISKHSDRKAQIEALLFGLAGFLEDTNESYRVQLSTEYDFLKKKYSLEGLHKSHWKFGKMRPGNFPTVRLIQFAGILQKSTKLFSVFSELSSLKDLKRFFNLNFSDYWEQHYDFGKPLKNRNNHIGNASIENLIINSISPVLTAYSIHTDQPKMMDKAISFLEQLPPESNRYTRKFEQLGRKPSSAFDSQAMITLYKDFCNRKKCLNCAVGSAIFQK